MHKKKVKKLRSNAKNIKAWFGIPIIFAFLFVLAFLFVSISWVGLALNREPPSTMTKAQVPLMTYLRKLPDVLRSNSNYTHFLISRTTVQFGAMASGFFIVYGSERFGVDGATIGALAETAGVNVETIRFYQRKGLMPEPEKPYGSIRRYGAAELARVRFIKSAQRLGFSLEEIGELLKLEDGARCSEARQLAEQKLVDVRQKLSDLQRIESVLAKDGYLLLGGAETVVGITEKFKPSSAHRSLYVRS